MKKLLANLKRTVVFIGALSDNRHPQIRGTGCLINVDKVFHLLTAKHLVIDSKTGDPVPGLLAFFNLKSGKTASRSLDEMRKMLGTNWIFHSEPNVDLAVFPFPIDVEHDDIKVVPDNLFQPPDALCELYDVFFLSYQPGIQPGQRINPIVRGGIISIINEDSTFYVDGSAFPGNSGSPVFLKPSPLRFTDDGLALGGDKIGGRFVGIVGEYIPYQETAVSTQTGRTRVVFEENTGLSRVWSVSFITDIIESDEFKGQIDRFKGTRENES